ncbi:organic solute transporter Ostalpha-domain-containing protein [Collybia nuda]|uniref:Organic solute transporter Ostalpha-domain-containing protein n=1 Tax=Collybia nuda TaxID=64659 RepID=A0A9P5Y1Y7_9AGAR|nr:organic solute transporter Ostalpha-domain-containing protein [Collybia nuda]
MNGPRDETRKCHREIAAEESPPLIQNGKIVFQIYHIGWIVAGLFAVVATVVSLWLVNKHLQRYTNRKEQRYVVRILFMVPVYALISFTSYLFWNHSTALLLLRDGYESTVLTAFFYLLLVYLSPDPEEQKAIFLKFGLSRNADRNAMNKGEQLKKWVFPLGFIRSKPQDGLYFLQMMKWGVLQYCVIRPTTTLAAVILDYQGLYCEESWGLGWGHIYITTIVSISVTVAMYCLIQLYIPVSKHLSPHKPLLKLFAIKAVVFLTFWQATFLSLLNLLGVVNDTKYMTAADINIGIGALLETFEMMVFALLHIRAFTYKPYVTTSLSRAQEPPARTPRLRALIHAMDFRESFREIWIGCVYIFQKLQGKEPTQDMSAKRVSHFEGAFGRARPSRITPVTKFSPDSEVTMERVAPVLPALEIKIDEHVDIEGERQWLGTGDDYGYGLEYIKRERSEGLGVQIERELEKRGYMKRFNGRSLSNPRKSEELADRKRHTWWRSIYNRISQSGHNMDESVTRNSHSNIQEARRGLLYDYGYGLDDPPPQNTSHVQNHVEGNNLEMPPIPETDKHSVLEPLPIFRGPYHEERLRHSLNSLSPLTGHPSLDLPNVLPSHIPRSESLPDRIFPPTMPTKTFSQSILQPQTNNPLHGDSYRRPGSIDARPPPLVYPRNRTPLPQHYSHRRESASHRPPIHSPFIFLVAAPVPLNMPPEE